MRIRKLPIIGTNTYISVAGISKVPAKVDTGAEFSSIWASDILINADGKLEFSLFAPGSPLYTGERIVAKHCQVRQVRNSTGDVELRYRVHLPTVVEGRKIKVSYTLANRATNNFPVLVGRRTIKGKFLVDVSKRAVGVIPKSDQRKKEDRKLNRLLRKNPAAFHQEYMN